MRTRTAWPIFALVVMVVIVIALMRFNPSAMKEPGGLETVAATFGIW
jgi:hypothetical protein